MKIAVDAMGGDNAPQAIVEGVMLAKQDFPDIEFQLYGPMKKTLRLFIPMKKLLVTMSQLKQSVVRKLLPWF